MRCKVQIDGTQAQTHAAAQIPNKSTCACKWLRNTNSFACNKLVDHRRKLERSLRGMEQGASVLEKAMTIGLPGEKSVRGKRMRGVRRLIGQGGGMPAVQGWEVIRAKWTKLQVAGSR